MTAASAVREVAPLLWPCDLELALPGSKSEANRMLVAAALSGQRTTLSGATPCDDVRYLLAGLASLGFETSVDAQDPSRVLVGPRSSEAPGKGELFCGNAGTALRFLVSVAALTPGEWTITGDAHMQRRPIGPLVAAWRSLGLEIEDRNGCPPVKLRGGACAGGRLQLDPSISSQYLSSLLLVGSKLASGLEIHFQGALASVEYAELTCALLARFGVTTELWTEGAAVRPGASGGPALVAVGGDWSAMGLWTCLAHLSGSRVRALNLRRDSGQADEQLERVLEALARGGNQSVDVRSLPDQFLNLAIVAARSTGSTRLVGAANLRKKECDRIAVMARELRRVGVRVEELPDGLVIDGARQLQAATIDPEGDHRVAMAFALAGLLSPGIRIADPGCVAKSYPAFWRDVEAAGQALRCVAVVGMRGAGKSTLAAALARSSGCEWIDTDQVFEKRNGPIASFVARRGWPAFREAEAHIVRASLGPGRIVSTGGGAIEAAATRAELRSRAQVVWLDASAAVLRARLLAPAEARPSVTGAPLAQELDPLLARRRPLYAEVAQLRVAAELPTAAQVEFTLRELARPCRFAAWSDGPC